MFSLLGSQEEINVSFRSCIFLRFIQVMTVYIIDHLMYKKFGPAKVVGGPAGRSRSVRLVGGANAAHSLIEVWRAERFFKGLSRHSLSS